MPRCAWLLIGALAALLNQTIGLTATVAFLFAAIGWVLTTPAALVIVASLSAWHLLSYHAPRRPRRTPTAAHH